MPKRSRAAKSNWLRLVPEREGELATQLFQTAGPQVLVQVQRDLAVGRGPEPVALLLQLALDPLEVVELAVDDDMHAPVLVRDWLVAGRQIDDAETRMAEPHAPVRSHPLPLPVRPAPHQLRGGALDITEGHGTAWREKRNDSTHPGVPYTTRRVPSAAQHPAAQPGNVSPNRGPD